MEGKAAIKGRRAELSRSLTRAERYLKIEEEVRKKKSDNTQDYLRVIRSETVSGCVCGM